jgi:hypothetical protein
MNNLIKYVLHRKRVRTCQSGNFRYNFGNSKKIENIFTLQLSVFVIYIISYLI